MSKNEYRVTLETCTKLIQIYFDMFQLDIKSNLRFVVTILMKNDVFVNLIVVR